MLEDLKKKCGWYEPEKNQEGKSVRHQEVAIKNKFKKDMPSCTVACLPPCGHKKDEVDIDEIDDNQEEDKRNDKEDKDTNKKEDK